MPKAPPTHRQLMRARMPQARPTENRPTAAKRGYNARWQKARRTYLQQHPLCVLCEKEGRVVPATVVDHITPHKGDSALFWDVAGNWQPLCKPHHDKKTASEGAFGRETQGGRRTA